MLPRQRRWMVVIGLTLVAAATSSPASAAEIGGVGEASAGCGASQAGPGVSQGEMSSAGLQRRWQLSVPPQHDGETPLPLIIQLHGYAANPTLQDSLSQLQALGTEEGFVTVTPWGRGQIPRWALELDQPDIDPTPANPDAIFIAELIDRLEAELCLDRDRIYEPSRRR